VYSSVELALAVAALKRKIYKVVAIVAQRDSALNEERIQLLKALKVEIVRTAASDSQNSPETIAKRMASETRNGMVLEQNLVIKEALTEMVGEIQDLAGITHIVFPDDGGSARVLQKILDDKYQCQVVSSHILNESDEPTSTSVSKREAYQTARDIISSHGILCGLQSGATVSVARRLMKSNPSAKIVCILDDPACHYHSTLLK
jgi:cysteine synthase